MIIWGREEGGGRWLTNLPASTSGEEGVLGRVVP